MLSLERFQQAPWDAGQERRRWALKRREKMMHRGLLFDLDGVLVDTAKYHYLAWSKIAQELGLPFTLQDNERLKGVSRERSFEILLELGGRKMEAGKRAEYCARKNEYYLSCIRQMTRREILPGVCDVLQQARKKDYRITLGSASRNSRLILERLELLELFDAIVDGTAVHSAKPDPEVFLQGAQALGLAPGECIVFEDARAGIEAAHAGGMPAVGIGDKKDLPEADLCLPGLQGADLSEIERCLAEKRERAGAR